MNEEEEPVDGLPLYRRLARRLRGEIDGGVFGGNAPLPSERELAHRFSVSRETVRKTMKLLESHGTIYSDQGRGTFAAPAAARRMSRCLDGFSADAVNRGAEAGQDILLLEVVPASTALASLLAIEPRTPVTRLKRLRSVDGMRVGLHDAFLKLPAEVSFSKADLVRAGSLYRLLADRFGLHPAEGLESIGAVEATLEDADYLDVAPGSPLLACERTTLSDRREPIEYCEMRYTPRYRYTNRVSRVSAVL